VAERKPGSLFRDYFDRLNALYVMVVLGRASSLTRAKIPARDCPATVPKTHKIWDCQTIQPQRPKERIGVLEKELFLEL
jgi:hypothetical protein